MKKMKAYWTPQYPGAMCEIEVKDLQDGLRVLEKVGPGGRGLMVQEDDGCWYDWEDGEGKDALFYLATSQY